MLLQRLHVISAGRERGPTLMALAARPALPTMVVVLASELAVLTCRAGPEGRSMSAMLSALQWCCRLQIIDDLS